MTQRKVCSIAVIVAISWYRVKTSSPKLFLSFNSVKALIISSEGASGDYPGCTDKAYAKAVSDGVDILDCPVQITSDGIPFCLGSINLRDRTNAVELNFSRLITTNQELNITDGIFAYSLTWSQIQTLKRK